MVYTKLILDDRKKKHNEIYAVVVRITHQRKYTTLTTGVRLEKKYWDKMTGKVLVSHPNHLILNATIGEFHLKVQRATLILQDNYSFEGLKEMLDEKSKPAKINTSITFNEFSNKIINDLFAINKTGNALVYQTASNRLIGFVNGRKLKFKEIDYSLLEAFQRYLISKKVKKNSISNYLRTIRAIYNRAIKAKIIDRSHYPFTEVSIKSERTAKRAVSINDLSRLNQLNLPEYSREWHARNYFFLSFCLIGISFTDLAYLKPSNIAKGKLTYQRRKTQKEYNIKLTAKAKQIIDYYSGKNEKYLLPILPASILEDSLAANQKIHQWIKTTNKWMKKLATQCDIMEPITTYVARHTWATTAKRLGYSNELIAEALGHEYGNKITNIYLDTFDQAVIDELNERVTSNI